MQLDSSSTHHSSSESSFHHKKYKSARTSADYNTLVLIKLNIYNVYTNDI